MHNTLYKTVQKTPYKTGGNTILGISRVYSVYGVPEEIHHLNPIVKTTGRVVEKRGEAGG